VLLKWMHTRKLVSLTDLLASGGSTVSKPQIPNPKAQIPSRPSSSASAAPRVAAPASSPAKSTAAPSNPESRIANPDLKDKLLAEIRSGKATFYNTVVAQAQRIDVTNDRITFVFGPAQSTLRGWFDQQKAWLDAAGERIAGRKIVVTSELGEVSPASGGRVLPDPADATAPAPPKRDLKAEAMSSSTVQAMLDVFPAEIRDVEEM
jgi:hypothetical protein